MECPHCHNKGNVLKRIFSKRKGYENRYCVHCNSEVKLIYNWKNIFLLITFVIIGLIIINFVIQAIGWPGISSGFAGGLGGSIIAVYMRKPPFLKIELISKSKTKRRK
ncbi:MAG: hypothetical protein PHE33_11025 [Bacteroidales bacterium]|nr:hypothetical protein [Bacteroidales bacterium]